MSLIDFRRCWSGRRWFNVGNAWFAIGFGPNYFIEQFHLFGRMVYAKRKGYPSVWVWRKV